MTDDTINPFQRSTISREFTELGPTSVEGDVSFSSTFGDPAGPHHTMVLYDDRGETRDSAELYAIAAANLTTHFGTVEVQTFSQFTSPAEEAEALVVLGSDHELPDPVRNTVLSGEIDVLWIGAGLEQLDPPELDGVAEESFVKRFGWDPAQQVQVDATAITQAEYRDHVVSWNVEWLDQVSTPMIIDADKVDVLALAQCESTGQGVCETNHGAQSEVPLVIRSQHLMVMTESPFEYIDTNPLYLMYADLLYELIAPETPESRLAAVRIEDVNPESDPEALRAIADYLASESIPFQVAVIPIFIDRTADEEDWYGLSLLDAPDVVEALKYMQERGATLVQHGTSHQYGADDNPYSGRSGADYEFYEYGCSATEEPPYVWEDCEQDSWVRKIGPVSQDRVEDHAKRLQRGKEIFIEAGLGEPTIFTPPHYTASVNGYAAIADLYEARYERTDYFAGLLSGAQSSPDASYSQLFPYRVHDIYGSYVYPENLENITEVEMNNHPIRTPQTLIEKAERNLMVTESTASFFFHPFLDIELLAEVVDGVRELGYTFVPVDELA